MVEPTTEQPEESPVASRPVWWVRLLAFLGVFWIGGFIDLSMSPGGAVQSFSDQVSYFTFLFPIYVPGLAAFAIGGSVHSGIIFFAALVVLYIGSLVLFGVFFSTDRYETWLITCVLLVIEVFLAVAGSSFFVSNMRGWT